MVTPPTPYLCSFVLPVTMPLYSTAVSKALRQTLRERYLNRLSSALTGSRREPLRMRRPLTFISEMTWWLLGTRDRSSRLADHDPIPLVDGARALRPPGFALCGHFGFPSRNKLRNKLRFAGKGGVVPLNVTLARARSSGDGGTVFGANMPNTSKKEGPSGDE